jgi:hypothetical protein
MLNHITSARHGITREYLHMAARDREKKGQGLLEVWSQGNSRKVSEAANGLLLMPWLVSGA